MPTSTGYQRRAGGGVVADTGSVPTIASAASIALLGRVQLISGAVAVTAITGHQAGEVYVLIFTGTATITNGATIKLAGGVNFVATANDVLTLVSDGTTLYEASRAIN